MATSQTLRLAFCLFAYRPYGGLQRDFRRIAEVCALRGHKIDVYTMEWQGSIPEAFDVHIISVRRILNHHRSRHFCTLLAAKLQQQDYAVVIGFNRITGLDIYYAADPCYVTKIEKQHSRLYRLSGRYRYFAAIEASIFKPESSTQILILSEQEIDKFVHFYQTPRERFHLLPPGIDPARQVPNNALSIRATFRAEHQLGEEDRLVLMVGSGFRTKGLDRALRALASLAQPLRKRTRLMVVGADNERPFRSLARRLGVIKQTHFMGGQPDVTRFMLGADLLIHPAYSENTGTVLLEAMIAGLPVLATDVCGYAFHIDLAEAGRILASPFQQLQLDKELAEMLDSPQRAVWSENGIRYGHEVDLYSMPEVVTDHIERIAGLSHADT